MEIARVQWVKRSLCKCEDLSRDPSTHVKQPDVVTHICSPRAPPARWEMETGKPQQLDQPGL